MKKLLLKKETIASLEKDGMGSIIGGTNVSVYCQTLTCTDFRCNTNMPCHTVFEPYTVAGTCDSRSAANNC
jgi:hypothetical protein